MPQFKPEGRDNVKDYLTTEGEVKHAAPVRDGLRVEIDGTKPITNLNSLCVTAGWYIDSVDWDRRVIYLFPMDGGPE